LQLINTIIIIIIIIIIIKVTNKMQLFVLFIDSNTLCFGRHSPIIDAKQAKEVHQCNLNRFNNKVFTSLLHCLFRAF